MKKTRWIAAGAALITFIIIAYSVHGGSPLTFDSVIQQAFFSVRSDWLDPLVIALTHLGDTKSIVIICLILLVLPKTRTHYGIPAAAAAITASSFNHYLKSVFMRPRPDELNFLIDQGGWSFPSGHSISALVVFGMLILLIRYYAKTDICTGICSTCHRRGKRSCLAGRSASSISRRTNILTALLLIPCFGIGLSRIYVGVHYPTDVLAGWCLGVIVICIVTEVMERIRERCRNNL